MANLAAFNCIETAKLEEQLLPYCTDQRFLENTVNDLLFICKLLFASNNWKKVKPFLKQLGLWFYLQI